MLNIGRICDQHSFIFPIPEMEERKTYQKRCRPSSAIDEVKLNSDYDISSTLMLISHLTGSKEKTKSLVVRRS